MFVYTVYGAPIHNRTTAPIRVERTSVCGRSPTVTQPAVQQRHASPAVARPGPSACEPVSSHDPDRSTGPQPVAANTGLQVTASTADVVRLRAAARSLQARG